MEILISGILGAIIWQSISLIAYAITDEDEDVGLQVGLGIPLLLTQLVIILSHKIKWLFFRKQYRFYCFKDTTLNDYEQIRCGIYAKPEDMQCFSFDTSEKYYVIKKEVANKYRYVPRSEILTKKHIQYGFAGMSKNYLNLFKKDNGI